MRVGVDAPGGVGDLDHPEQLDRARARRRLGHALVGADRLDDLRAHAVERVQRGQRILEDHCDLVAAHLAQRLVVELEQVAPAEQDLPADLRPLGARQAEDAERGDGLARAGLADDPERAGGLELQRDPVQGLHETVFGGERHAQIANREQRLARGAERPGRQLEQLIVRAHE